MNSRHFPHPEAERSRLLALVAKLDREISRLPRQDISDVKHPSNDLFVAWVDLVATLELGPKLEVRECPACSHIFMREAAACTYCRVKLSPSAERDGVAG